MTVDQCCVSWLDFVAGEENDRLEVADCPSVVVISQTQSEKVALATTTLLQRRTLGQFSGNGGLLRRWFLDEFCCRL